MPSVNFILELRPGIRSVEHWPPDLIFLPLAGFYLKPKADEVEPECGKQLVACQPILDLSSPDVDGMLRKPSNHALKKPWRRACT